MNLMPLLISFCVVFVCAPVFRKLALRLGFVDKPSSRKLQEIPVPLLGGAAVYLGVAAGILVSSFSYQVVLPLFCGATLIFVVSLIDDKKELSARFRILAQFIAAGVLIVFGARVDFMPNNLLGDTCEIILTLIWIIGITNSFNYLDGIDGLCSGLGVISALFFWVILFWTGQKEFIVLPLALIGACLGFMPHNLKREKMFLGDAGSMFIGFLLAGISLMGHWASDSMIKVSIPILILGVPIFDMAFTTIMRFREKKIRSVVQWLEYAGRDHFHHYLIDLGLHTQGAAMFIFAISISMGISAVIIAESDRALDAVLTIFKSAIMFGLIGVLMALGRRLHKEKLVRERMGI